MNRRGARFVGRRPQLGQLRVAFERAADGAPAATLITTTPTVLVSGDAGIGRTRLVGELGQAHELAAAS